MSRATDALVQLQAELERAGHPIARYPEPAVTRTEVEAAFRPLGLTRLPDDVVALWEWQSSTRGAQNQASDPWPAYAWLPGGLELRPIVEVVRWHLEIDIDALAPVGIDNRWLPVMGNPHRHCWVDCNDDAKEVEVVVGSLTDPKNHVSFDSLGDLLAEMAQMLAEGVWIELTDDSGEIDWGFAGGAELEQYRWTY